MGSELTKTSIQQLQLDLLFKSTSKVTYIFPVTASVLVAIFYAQVPLMQLLGWWVAVILCSALRFSIQRRFNAMHEKKRDYQYWLQHLIAIDICSGLSAGMLAMFVMYLPIELELLVLVVLIAISMESVGAQSAIKASFICFVFTLFSTMVFWLLMVGGQLNYAIALLALVHVVLLWGNFKSLNTTIQRNFELGLKNQRLNADLQQTNQALSLSRDQALQTNSAQAKFIADMSHELRTPMQGLLGSIELARQQSANRQISKTLQIAQAAGVTLLNLLNGILELSRTEANMRSQSTELCNLSALGQELIDLVAITAESKGLNISFHADSALSQQVKVDKNRLSQIVLNFLSNAIKFTDKGEIRLVLQQVPVQSNRFLITVSDTGIGIEQADISRVFERYKQLPEGNERGGSGLGLAISAELSRIIGAEIKVTSTVGQGSAFSIEFGAESVAPMVQQNPETQGAHAAGINDMKVLLAEDEPLSRRVLEAFFNGLGIKPCIVVNGEDAVNACMTQQFDLILMDCQMPKLDGLQASQKIRDKCSHNANSYIVAMSAHIESQSTETINHVGVDLLLSKPIEQSQLTSILHQVKFGEVPNRD